MSTELRATDLRQPGARLFEQWTELWNGDLALAERILTSEFRIRFGSEPTATNTAGIRTPDDLVAFIRAHRDSRQGIRYHQEAAPIVDTVTGQVACRWNAARPGATTVSGIDLLAVLDGRIAEVWSVSGNRIFAAGN